MELPLITIVTLSYKNFKYIFETIESVYTQTYPNIEYIISDDGSNNFPENEIKEFIDKFKRPDINLTIIKHQINIGTVANLNNAWKLAKGKYIIPLSGDDSFYKNETVLNIVKDMETNNYNILITRRLLCDENNSIIGISPHTVHEKTISNLNCNSRQFYLIVMNSIFFTASGASTYFKREFWEKMGGFDSQYYLLEDKPFYTKISSRGYFINYNFDIISIRYRYGGVSTNASVSPIFEKDLDTYKNNIANYNFKSLPFKMRRDLKYMIKRINNQNSLRKFLLRLFYIDIILKNKYYNVLEKLAWKFDEKYIKKHNIK